MKFWHTNKELRAQIKQLKAERDELQQRLFDVHASDLNLKYEQDRNRDLETELEKRQARISILEDRNEFLSNVNALNARHLEDVMARIPEYGQPHLNLSDHAHAS